MAATAFLSPRLTGRPVIWDREEGRPASPTAGAEEPGSPRVRQRALHLRRALEAVGVRSGQRVVVLCCAAHVEDRQVALAALEALGATAVVPVDWSVSAIAGLFSGSGHQAVHLACEEGVEAWRAARGTGVMIGDGFGVLWWKALECRYASVGTA